MYSENLKALLLSEKFNGLGEKTIGTILNIFSNQQLIEVLDNENEEALIGILTPNKVTKLFSGWKKAKSEIELVRWLDSYNVDSSIGNKIWRLWQHKTIDKIRENPYRLLAFLSWKHVDSFAIALGCDPFNKARLCAIVEQCMYVELESNGSTKIKNTHLNEIISKFISKSKGGKSLSLNQLNEAASCAVDLAKETGSIIEVSQFIQLPGPYFCEKNIEEFIVEKINDKNVNAKLSEARINSLNLKSLTNEQLASVNNAINNKVSLFFGGAGVGKTYTVASICKAANSISKKPLLMALSAKAVRKLASVAQQSDAMTLAKCLSMKYSGFMENRLIVIDESSMIDMLTFRNLTKKIPESSHLVLCGDFAQLPPIGSGNIFYSLIHKSAVKQQELTEVYRQSSLTGIPSYLSLIRIGQLDTPKNFQAHESLNDGVYYMSSSKKSFLGKLISLVDLYGDSSQIISPLINGAYGTKVINEAIQNHKFATLKPVKGTPLIFNKNIRLSCGETVYNSQMAKVVKVLINNPVSPRSNYLVVDFGVESLVTITLAEYRDYTEFSHAITVHKAQGSDWDTVITVFPDTKFVERAMVYTAISRCKKRCICLFQNQTGTINNVADIPSYEKRTDGIFDIERNL
jgi:exodeoxyribonuclease V alpha subunit